MTAKKIANAVGSVLTVAALVFIVYRMAKMDVDYSALLDRKNIFWVLVLSVLYGVHIAATPFSWKTIISIVCGRVLPFYKVQRVFCRSNLMKYLPGNVFQYIGRNEIAVIYDLPHKEIALTTALDVGATVLGVAFCSTLCYATGFRKGIQSVFTQLNSRWIMVALAVVAVLCVVIYMLRGFLLEKLRVLLQPKNLVRYLFCIAYYAFLAVFTGWLFLLTLKYIVGRTLQPELIPVIMGAYQISWLLGFLTPGAPGGVGIREAVIVALLAPFMPSDPVLLAIVIYRVINTLGDFLAFLYCLVRGLFIRDKAE